MEERTFSGEEMIQGILQTALSFYYHNPHVQYDSNPMLEPFGWKIRRCDTRMTAEDAAPDQIVYTVCSDFVHRVYRDAADFYLAPTSREYWCVESTRTPADDPITVYKFDSEDTTISAEEAVEECFKLLQPGDVLIYFVQTPNAEGGHAMLYLGDYFGDGNRYILHSCAPGGGKFSLDTGIDPTEPYGTIQLQTTDEICFHPKKKILGNRDLGLAKRFVLHRPLNVMPRKLTPPAITRLQYPFMELNKSLSRSQYSHVVDGETISMTVTVMNHSDKPYENLSVTEPLPAGQKLLSVTGGGREEQGAIHWNLSVAPGELAILRYTVQVTGRPGEEIAFPQGLVGQIPTRAVSVKVGGGRLHEAQIAALGKVAAQPPKLPFRDLDTVNDFYRTVLGREAGLPKTFRELWDSLFTVTRYPDADGEVAELKENAVLPVSLLQKHIAGKYYYAGRDMTTRVTEYYERHYQPGDVFVCLTGESTTCLQKQEDLVLQIYLGGGKVLTMTESGTSVGGFSDTVGRNLRMNLLLVFRPVMA